MITDKISVNMHNMYHQRAIKMMKLRIIQGGIHTDHLGTIMFANDFDLKDVRRFYTIHQPDTSIIRAWQGHQFEAKYFHVVKGSFRIELLRPDNWEQPSKDLPLEITFFTDNPS
jgi:dTDP-4-dehydrorhamnose 3,5-epimerase